MCDIIHNMLQSEDWFPLTGITPIGEWGSVRLRIRYLHDLIMPIEEYSPMLQLLLDPDLEAVKALSDVCHPDRMPLANALFRIFRLLVFLNCGFPNQIPKLSE